MVLPTRFALLNFLKARRVLEGGTAVVYFRVHEHKDEYHLLDQDEQPLATTSRDAFLLFLTTYTIALAEEDAAGFQLWQMRLDTLDSPRDSGPLATSFIRR